MKVVCVNPGNTKHLRMGATYTVIDTHGGCPCLGPAYYLREAGIMRPLMQHVCKCPFCGHVLSPTPWKTVYRQSRFIPLDPPQQETTPREKELSLD